MPNPGIVYGLLRDIAAAGKIAQAAKHCHLEVHNFDRSQGLLEHSRLRRPLLMIVDWDGCEAEGYKVLKEIRQNADLNGVAVIGFVSGQKLALREEAQRAGCHRVYHKTEFMKDLELIMARYQS